MIFGLLSVIIGIIIPIAIVYFQGTNKYSNYFFEFYLKLASIFRIILFTVLLLTSTYIIDIFNIPSKVSPLFIGKQIYPEIIIIIVIIIIYIRIISFYIKYYNFHKNSNVYKFNILFQYIFRKMLEIQNNYKWKKINDELEILEKESDFDLFRSDYSLTSSSILESNLTIIKIKTKPIRKIKDKICFRLICGTNLKQNTWIASFENDIERKKFSRKIKKYIKLGIDYESILYGLMQFLLDEIKIAALDKNYQIIRDNVAALTTTIKTISSSDILLQNIKSLLSNIYWAMEDLLKSYNSEERINSIVKDFFKAFSILSINDNNSSVIELSFNLTLRIDFIEFDSKKMINRGFLHYVHEILRTICNNVKDTNLEFTIPFIKRLFEISQDFSGEELSKIKNDITDMIYLQNSLEFTSKPYLYSIFILYISYIEESDLYEDIVLSKELKRCYNALKYEIFERNDKLVSFVDRIESFFDKIADN